MNTAITTQPAAISLREQVQANDAVTVRRLAAATSFFSPTEVNVAVELVDERLAKADASGYHFIFAERESSVLGYCCYGPIACTLASFDLYWIVVDPSQQRQGVGRRLLDEAEQLIRRRGGARIYVETSSRPQYAPTRDFYSRCGYETAAVLAEFYGPEDDKVVFVKVLDPTASTAC